MLDSVGMVLRSEGFDLRLYAAGEGFLSDLDGLSTLDCVVLDPHLPGISGADVAGVIITSTIPIVVLTARPDSQVTRQIMKLGAKVLFEKPVSAEALVSKITSLVGDPK